MKNTWIALMVAGLLCAGFSFATPAAKTGAWCKKAEGKGYCHAGTKGCTCKTTPASSVTYPR